MSLGMVLCMVGGFVIGLTVKELHEVIILCILWSLFVMYGLGL